MKCDYEQSDTTKSYRGLVVGLAIALKNLLEFLLWFVGYVSLTDFSRYLENLTSISLS
ncbi:hypothetical protein [Nostoc sp. CALU 546]|uniref:hypothetical protein n=1 Tax=Nostoc sp. CALU 546 TaxID=1867241 RepID=UPI00159F30E2